MKNNFQSRHKILLISVLSFISILLIAYFLFPSELVYNNISQEISINGVDKSHLIEMEKHPEQGFVHALEIELTGELSENAEIWIGEEPGRLNHRTLLKKGEVKLEYSSDWYSDRCFFMLTEKEGRKGHLTLKYRFQAGSSN